MKLSVLGKKTDHRPNEFLMKYYNHMCSRFKGDQFGIAQSSRGRKKAQDKVDDLNVADEWSRRAQTDTKNNRDGHFFSDKVAQTNASKLA